MEVKPDTGSGNHTFDNGSILLLNPHEYSAPNRVRDGFFSLKGYLAAAFAGLDMRGFFAARFGM